MIVYVTLWRVANAATACRHGWSSSQVRKNFFFFFFLHVGDTEGWRVAEPISIPANWFLQVIDRDRSITNNHNIAFALHSRMICREHDINRASRDRCWDSCDQSTVSQKFRYIFQQSLYQHIDKLARTAGYRTQWTAQHPRQSQQNHNSIQHRCRWPRLRILDNAQTLRFTFENK